jgi:hypothetical protein
MDKRVSLGMTIETINLEEITLEAGTPVTFEITPKGYICTVALGEFEGTMFRISCRVFDNCVMEVDNWRGG